jgi:hypothetical protein
MLTIFGGPARLEIFISYKIRFRLGLRRLFPSEFVEDSFIAYRASDARFFIKLIIQMSFTLRGCRLRVRTIRSKQLSKQTERAAKHRARKSELIQTSYLLRELVRELPITRR